MNGYKHYIRTDAAGVIIHRFSNAFEEPLPSDICVNEDGGRHYNDPVTNERGQFFARWDETQEVARSQTELDAEYAAIPKPPDPDAELAAAITGATTIAQLKDALLGGNGRLARVRGRLK